MKSKQSANIVLKSDNGFENADGKPTYEGEQIQIGGNETYIPVCRKTLFSPEIK